jgi:hypothetical protein
VAVWNVLDSSFPFAAATLPILNRRMQRSSSWMMRVVAIAKIRVRKISVKRSGRDVGESIGGG